MELTELREQIDGIDAELLSLLERRMDVAAAIAEVKGRTGKPVLDQAREAEKLARIKRSCREETGNGIAAVFETILAASRAHQTRILEERHG